MQSKNVKILTIPFAFFVLAIAYSKFGANTFFEKNIASYFNAFVICLIMLCYFGIKQSKTLLHITATIVAIALLTNAYYFLKFSIENNNTKYLAMLSIIPFSGYFIHYYYEVFDY